MKLDSPQGLVWCLLMCLLLSPVYSTASSSSSSSLCDGERMGGGFCPLCVCVCVRETVYEGIVIGSYSIAPTGPMKTILLAPSRPVDSRV